MAAAVAAAVDAPTPAVGSTAVPSASTDTTAEASTAAAAVGSDSDSLSFWGCMWDRFNDVCQRRVEPSRRLLEDFSAALRERAQAEQLYAQAIMQSVARLERHADEGPLPSAIDAVMTNMRNRAEQSAQLAEDLDGDVAATVDVMLRQHEDVSRRAFSDGQKLVRHWVETNRAHEAAAAKYSKACADAEEIAAACINDVSAPPQQRLRLAARSLAASRPAALAEREYHRAVRRLNEAVAIHERQMGMVLAALQDMEEKRARCVHDTGMKLAVYDASWLRNAQYDLDAVVKTVESEQPLEELHDFIRRHKSTRPPPTRLTPRPFWAIPSIASPSGAVSAAGGEADSAGHPSASSRARCASNGAEPGAEALRPLLQSLMGATDDAAGAAADVDSSQAAALEDLRQRLAGSAATARVSGGNTGSPSGTSAGDAADGGTGADGSPSGAPPGPGSNAAASRASLCVALRAEIGRLQANSAAGADSSNVGIDEAKPVVVPLAAFEAIAGLVTAALEGCDRDNDAWSGRDLLVLSQLVQSECNGQIMDVLLRVYSHALWSRVNFWEDVLLVGLAEAHCEPALARRTCDPTSLEAAAAAGHQGPVANHSVEAPMTPFLRRFPAYMKALGIKPEQAIGCVHKTLRKHAAALGPAADVYADLLTRELRAGAANAGIAPTPRAAGGAAAPAMAAATAVGEVPGSAAESNPAVEGKSMPSAVAAAASPYAVAPVVVSPALDETSASPNAATEAAAGGVSPISDDGGVL